MIDRSKKKTISEGDIATLLQRYDTTTILRLLQEMAYYSEINMDWNEMVKKTTTGITNAREYQMLWRHLSYRDPLLSVEDDTQPLEDDSDMECELEASPAVSFEASVEAIAHVKVMAASYVPSETDILDDSAVEAPMTINIPYGLPEGTQEPSEYPWSSRGMNITFPVCLQKASSTEGMNENGSASSSMTFRRKRKKWSAEEDEELIAAVKRCGEGNWAHIVKGDFRGERTASQLSQRWALIKRRVDTSTAVSQSGLQRTEAQIAVNHAISLALGNPPPPKRIAAGISPTTSSCSVTETRANGVSSSQGHQQSKPVVQALPRAATLVPASKPRVLVKKPTASFTSRSDLMLRANSVAEAAIMGGVSTAAASVPKVEPGKTNAPLVPKTEPAKSTMIPAYAHLASASRMVSNQRVFAASVPVPRKPDGGQKEKAQGDRASSLATQAHSPSLLPRKIPTAVQGGTNQKLVVKPSDKTAVPSISGAGSQSKAKCEVNSKVGVCGKPPEVATVAGTGQGV